MKTFYLRLNDDDFKRYNFLANYQGLKLNVLIKRLLEDEVLSNFDSNEHMISVMKSFIEKEGGGNK